MSYSERILGALPILALFQEFLSSSRSTRESEVRFAYRHFKVLSTSSILLSTSSILLSPPTPLPLYDALTLTVALDFYLLPLGAVKLCEILRMYVYVCVGGMGGESEGNSFLSLGVIFRAFPPFFCFANTS
jgi:hypothetical protein